jgi:hypothetical protein
MPPVVLGWDLVVASAAEEPRSALVADGNIDHSRTSTIEGSVTRMPQDGAENVTKRGYRGTQERMTMADVARPTRQACGKSAPEYVVGSTSTIQLPELSRRTASTP